ncbi:TPA: hypothetical protein DIS57_01575 [Candidatus Wolfebacteria bacterium]|nr:hypothetical protein [Candidatus Wolfebacteria bacterium]HCM52626.1 hypothetical protein [Candidatus Wolfebacteria bacterium]
MRKFIIGLIVGIFCAMGIWYLLTTSESVQPALVETAATSSATPKGPGATSGYGPTTPPSVTPPTTPPPAY